MLMTDEEYVESLRKLGTRVYMFGERVENWVDHPIIRPSINCVKMTCDLAQDPQALEVGKRLFFLRGGSHDFACASCHGEDGKRIRLQDLPKLTGNPGDGVGFSAWPAYRVSSGEMWSMQHRLNDCYRQQRFPEPIFGSDATIALGVYMGVNAKGDKSAAPTIKR